MSVVVGYISFYIGSAIILTAVSYYLTHKKNNRNAEITILQIKIENMKEKRDAAVNRLRTDRSSLHQEEKELKDKIQDNRKDLRYTTNRRNVARVRLGQLRDILQMREDFKNGN